MSQTIDTIKSDQKMLNAILSKDVSMPQVMYKAKEIANYFKQDILMAEFINLESKKEFNVSDIRWDQEEQKKFLDWVEEHLPGIKWQKCFPNYGDGWIVFPYLGHIALIVNEFDQPLEYQKIVSRWENEQGEPINERMRLYLVKYDR